MEPPIQNIFEEVLPPIIHKEIEKKIAIVGSQNVGKNNLFHALTKERIKIKQYGSTFCYGSLHYQKDTYIFYDLPNANSLLGNDSVHSNASCIRDFICLSSPDVVLFICDYYTLEENLQFLFQILEITDNIVVCLTEHKFFYKSKPSINIELLSKNIGLPVLEITLGNKASIESFITNLHQFIHNPIVFNPIHTGYPLPYENAMLQLETLLHVFSFKNMKIRWLFLELLKNNMSFLSLDNHSFDKMLQENTELKIRLDDIQKELEHEFPKEHWIDDILFSHLKRSQKIFENTVNVSSLSIKKKEPFFRRFFRNR
ncbi:FeoB small GTPase domain-containing protein [Anaeromicropila herbilytica]|uniref:FeoB-type G domain-containing protein n=1 Tax=Anaeromicropila herbilytica TaxID=2785025 RepID=A0A7R7EJ26_9FIRM|nr:FeoB small GTPase domain-containing protein [Anaeromicropila herbilytica]BCN29611.1 hypothetical protein bsdtb5_09060 [Anaeromicropila herbilytica]